MGRKLDDELTISEKKLLDDLEKMYHKKFYIFKPTTEQELSKERTERFYYQEKMIRAGLAEL